MAGRVGVTKVYKTTHYAIEKGYPLVVFGEGGGTRMPDNLGAANHMRTPTLMRRETRDRRVAFVDCIMGESYGSPTWKGYLASSRDHGPSKPVGSAADPTSCFRVTLRG